MLVSIRNELMRMNLPRYKLSTFITCRYPFRLVSIFTWDNAEGRTKKITLTKRNK
jgi:hypothetical protein